MSSFASEMRRVAREQARSQREHERAVTRQQKEEARAYSNSRLELAADETTLIKVREELISSLLVRSIGRYKLFDFEAEKKAVDNTNFESTVHALEQPRWERFVQQEPKGFARLIPGSRRRFRMKELLARNKYDQATFLYQEATERNYPRPF